MDLLVRFERGDFVAVSGRFEDVIAQMIRDLEDEMGPRDRVRLAAVLDKWKSARVQRFENDFAFQEAILAASRVARGQGQSPIIVGS